MKLRPAAAGDVEQLLALIRETPLLPQWGKDALALPGSCEGLQEDAQGLQRGLLVAELDGAIAGFAQYSLLFDEAELESMAVAAPMRRHGVGRALLTAVLREVHDAGGERMRLEVRAGNGAAIALYRSTGFLPIGLRRGYYRGPAEDAVVMQRSWAG